MDSTLKVTELVTPKNKYTIFYYKIPVSFGSPYVRRVYRELCEGILYTLTQCTIHTPYRSQYAAIALTTPCTSFTQILLTKRVIFSQALTLAA